MTAARLLPRRAATDGADPIVENLLPRRDDRVLGKAVAVALALHAVLFFVNLPEPAEAPPAPAPQRPTFELNAYPLPPPEIIDNVVPPSPEPQAPKVFVPVAPPDDPGPERDEPPVDMTDTAPPDFDIDWIDIEPVGPPPPPGPFEVFDSGVEPPVLITDCKVAPDYPEIPRIARREGSVVLRAVIRADGSVGEIEVLSARPPNFGFDEAAGAAVAQWCYEPATFNGVPMDVYFTIYVTFRLQ